MAQEQGLMTLQDVMAMGDVFYKSGMFSDVKSAAQAVVKIQAGAELGIAPFAAMTGIFIIEGKPGLGAGLIAGKIKASGKYDYRVVRLDNDGCVLEFYQSHTKLGESSFTREDAGMALYKNTKSGNMEPLIQKYTWRQYPRNMMFARAISNGARWYCPDIFSGSVYTPEELGDDNTVDVSFQVVEEQPAQVEPEPVAGTATDARWLDNRANLKEFWGLARDLGLARQEEVCQILEVKRLADYLGTQSQAEYLLRQATMVTPAVGEEIGDQMRDLWDDDDPGDAPEDDAPLRP